MLPVSLFRFVVAKTAVSSSLILFRLKQKKDATTKLQIIFHKAIHTKGTFDYVKGGGGSGDVTVAYTRNLYEGLSLQKDKISIFEELCDYYRKDIEEQYKNGNVPGMTIEPDVPNELLQKAKAYTDTAIITICRYSGEGWDRKSVIDPNKDRKSVV